MLADIKNFVALTEHVGTSGQPTAAQFTEIANAGYRAVINLALPTSDHAIPDESSLVTRLGMAYVHIPVRFEQPTAEDLALFIRVMRAFAGRKVFVHCVANLRVSAFMYHYLRYECGYDDAAASSPILIAWTSRMDPIWQAFMKLDRGTLGI